MAVRLTETRLRQIIRQEASRLIREMSDPMMVAPDEVARAMGAPQAGGLVCRIVVSDEGVFVEVPGAPRDDVSPSLQWALDSAVPEYIDGTRSSLSLMAELRKALPALRRMGVEMVEFEDNDGDTVGPVPLDKAPVSFARMVSLRY